MTQEFDKPFANSIDLKKKELKNAVIHRVAYDLNNPTEGQIWYNQTEDIVKIYNGSAKKSFVFTSDVGDAITPVVRTNNPTLATNSVNANISELDNAIGTSPTPVVRTTGPIAAANSVNTNIDALDTAIGANVTVTSRTVGPLIAANTVNANINALDTAIGTDAQISAVSRTAGPVAVANSVNSNIDALDAAIGADASPAGTRTAGSIAAANSVNANIDALDAAIGFEAQISGTPNVVTKTGTVFQMIDQLDAYKSVQTIKKTIGGIGVTADFNFTTAEDQVEQVIDLGAIVPAKARIVDVVTYTDEVFTGAVSLAAETGTTSSGDELIASATIYATDAITATANSGAFIQTPSATAKHIYVSATPGANWSAVTAGKVSVYVTFINLTNI